MKTYRLLIVLQLITLNSVFCQVKGYKSTESGIEFTFQFEMPSVKEFEKDGVRVYDYYEHYDEGLHGSPVLPEKVFLLAIPSGAIITPQIEPLKENRYTNAMPSLHPKLVDLGDTSYYDFNTHYSSGILSSVENSGYEIKIVGYHWIREYYVAVVSVKTHSFDWRKKEISELTEAKIRLFFNAPFTRLPGNSSENEEKLFELKSVLLNYEDAPSFKASPKITSDSSGTWIDYSQNYLKIAIPQDGIYRISGQDLVNFGIDISFIQPRSVKLFIGGHEQQLHLLNNNNPQFQVSDYLEFYSDRNYGDSDYRSIVPHGGEYLSFNNRYSDTLFAWLTWGGEDGQRTLISNLSGVATLDTISSHLAKIHLEQDVRLWYYDAMSATTQLPMWQNKTWSWQFFGKGGTASFPFNASSIVPSTRVKIWVRNISNAADVYTGSHLVGIGLNNSPVLDSIGFDYRQTVNLYSNQASSMLLNGANTIKVYGLPTPASFYQVLVDWLDIDYYRYNTMTNDSLKIVVPDSVSRSFRIVRITNAPDQNVMIYKTNNQHKKIGLFTYAQGTITFADTVAGGDVYYIVHASKIKNPVLKEFKKFQNVRQNLSGADYIVISNKQFRSEVVDYAAFVRDNYKVRVNVAYVEDLIDEFNYGQPDPNAIRDYLKFVFLNWPSPKPAYVFFIGDASYDYKLQWSPAPIRKKLNHVFSFGHPVSDPWFTVFDELSPIFPQMYVGRLPVNDPSEIIHYKEKHNTTLLRPYDLWNKSALFFSGGDVNNAGELQQIYNTNQYVLSNTHSANPFGGLGKHFYKTLNPPTNFGPYSADEVNDAINDGGVYISYIGHSGTQTWDNGVTTVSFLKNKFSDRHPLISDFGCSTGKFAEPDVDAFGESFVRDINDGQAIAYLGNSSFGYLSTSLRFPKLFYGTMLNDSITTLGKAHYLAKIKNIQESGINDVNKVFTFCNLLFGDPIVNLKLPQRPNFVIKESDITLKESNPNESMDSILVEVEVRNVGNSFRDSIEIQLQHTAAGIVVSDRLLKIVAPVIADTLSLRVPAKGYVGQNEIRISIDPGAKVDEIYKDDNAAKLLYTVYSVSTRPLVLDSYYSVESEYFRIMNPVYQTEQVGSQLRYRIDTSYTASSGVENTKNWDSVSTAISLAQIADRDRVWLRSKPDISSVEWSEPVSLIRMKSNFKWYADSPIEGAAGVSPTNVLYDHNNLDWSLQEKLRTLSIISAGTYEGSFASVLLDNDENLPNTYFWGIVAVPFDSVSLLPTSIRYFDYPATTAAPKLIEYIDSLSTGTIVGFAICVDGAQSVLGYSGGTEARKALKKMGSQYADSIRYRESWSMIGRKGATIGSVPEVWKKHFEGPARIDMSKNVIADSGYIAFPKIGPASRWGEMAIKRQLPAGTKLITDVYGIKNDGSEALLLKHTSADTALSLTSINPTQYPFIRLQPNFYANNLKQSPALAVAAVDFDGLPELAINYQVMSLSRDSVMQGETVDVMFDVYNVGFSVAKQFQVVLEGVDPNNARTTLATYQVDTLGKNSKKRFAHTYTAVGQQNRMTFVVTIDPQNAVSELYEDNNSFSRELKITQDTSRPSVFVTFDDIDILDGDFVSSKPTIDVVYNDPSALTAADTGLVQIFLNNTRIYHNDPSITTSFNTANPKIKVQYKPELEDGKHQLKVQYTNPSGSFTDTSGVKKIFTVESQPSLTYVYNYPNPMKDETYFTFKLTTIPKEFFIKIYTIAGRLIREISVPITDLKHDFNRIYWDGKDQDGDAIANGVYFARFIMKADDKNEIVTQKIAVVK